MGEMTVFSTNSAGKLDIYMQKNDLDPYVTPYIKIHSKRIKDLNVRTKTIKFLEENIGGNLHDPGFGGCFLSITPKAQAIKEKK